MSERRNSASRSRTAASSSSRRRSRNDEEAGSGGGKPDAAFTRRVVILGGDQSGRSSIRDTVFHGAVLRKGFTGFGPAEMIDYHRRRSHVDDENDTMGGDTTTINTAVAVNNQQVTLPKFSGMRSLSKQLFPLSNSKARREADRQMQRDGPITTNTSMRNASGGGGPQFPSEIFSTRTSLGAQQAGGISSPVETTSGEAASSQRASLSSPNLPQPPRSSSNLDKSNPSGAAAAATPAQSRVVSIEAAETTVVPNLLNVQLLELHEDHAKWLATDELFAPAILADNCCAIVVVLDLEAFFPPPPDVPAVPGTAAPSNNTSGKPNAISAANLSRHGGAATASGNVAADDDAVPSSDSGAPLVAALFDQHLSNLEMSAEHDYARAVERIYYIVEGIKKWHPKPSLVDVYVALHKADQVAPNLAATEDAKEEALYRDAKAQYEAQKAARSATVASIREGGKLASLTTGDDANKKTTTTTTTTTAKTGAKPRSPQATSSGASGQAAAKPSITPLPAPTVGSSTSSSALGSTMKGLSLPVPPKTRDPSTCFHSADVKIARLMMRLKADINDRCKLVVTSSGKDSSPNTSSRKKRNAELERTGTGDSATSEDASKKKVEITPGQPLPFKHLLPHLHATSLHDNSIYEIFSRIIARVDVLPQLMRLQQMLDVVQDRSRMDHAFLLDMNTRLVIAADSDTSPLAFAPRADRGAMGTGEVSVAAAAAAITARRRTRGVSTVANNTLTPGSPGIRPSRGSSASAFAPTQRSAASVVTQQSAQEARRANEDFTLYTFMWAEIMDFIGSLENLYSSTESLMDSFSSSFFAPTVNSTRPSQTASLIAAANAAGLSSTNNASALEGAESQLDPADANVGFKSTFELSDGRVLHICGLTASMQCIALVGQTAEFYRSQSLVEYNVSMFRRAAHPILTGEKAK